jgi:1-deoxy-D-xylulose-5-phosphate synthase
MTLRDGVEDLVGSAGRVGRFLVSAGETAKESFKKLMVPGTLFEDIGIIYIGPIDGHNIEMVNKALRVSNKAQGPVLIHMVTQKGRGFAPAELQPEVFHGIGSFDPNTGRIASKSNGGPSFTEVLSQALLDEASVNDDIVAITAAMEDGTGLAAFKEAYPERFIDVGIAEEHAVALAGGLALGGKLPVVAIYSTFLQRAYDQIVINVALQRQHVVFCVDRGGLVGEDGSTHHGIFDLAYLRSVPNMRILAPADRQQLRDALHTALALRDGPIALRYPRGEAPVPTGAGGYPAEDREPINLPIGKAIKVRDGGDVSILAVGRMLVAAEQAAQLLAEQGIQAAVYNMLWVKPLDEQAVAEAAMAPLLVTIEDGTVAGGFGGAVSEVLAAIGVNSSEDSSKNGSKNSSGECRAWPRLLSIGIPDQFVQHGSVDKLFEQLEMTAPQIAKRISDAIKRESTSD